MSAEGADGEEGLECRMEIRNLLKTLKGSTGVPFKGYQEAYVL